MIKFLLVLVLWSPQEGYYDMQEEELYDTMQQCWDEGDSIMSERIGVKSFLCVQRTVDRENDDES